MKRFTYILGVATLLILPYLTTSAKAQETDSTFLNSMDSVEISLLTCGPGSEVYSHYGHTAIRICDMARQHDIAVNFGIFSFEQKHFMLRFILGQTDYKMGITPLPLFCNEYRSEKRWVTQQTLCLTRTEKRDILQAVAINAQPENSTYRYNYFYNNCTTKARDILLQHLTEGCKIEKTDSFPPLTHRQQIHQYIADRPWERFGIDLLLGLKADQRITASEADFLPINLMRSFRAAMVVCPDSCEYPLVTGQHYLLAPPTSQTEESISVLSPTRLFSVLLLITLLISSIHRIRRYTWLYDLFLLGADGLAGLILFAMIFSEHPTVSLNLQIFLLSPLSLIFLYPTIMKERQGLFHGYWYILLAFLIVFFAGNTIQCYAEGTNILALSLLVRTMYNIYQYKKKAP